MGMLSVGEDVLVVASSIGLIYPCDVQDDEIWEIGSFAFVGCLEAR